MATPTTYINKQNHQYFPGENEFNEFDIWNTSTSPDLHKPVTCSPIATKSTLPATKSRKTVRKHAVSLPVDVPDWSMILKDEVNNNRKAGCHDDDYVESDDLIPPHEYLARMRIDPFSVHEGFGRTLKGRDLSRVRNAVWEKIGFED